MPMVTCQNMDMVVITHLKIFEASQLSLHKMRPRPLSLASHLGVTDLSLKDCGCSCCPRESHLVPPGSGLFCSEDPRRPGLAELRSEVPRNLSCLRGSPLSRGTTSVLKVPPEPAQSRHLPGTRRRVGQEVQRGARAGKRFLSKTWE